MKNLCKNTETIWKCIPIHVPKTGVIQKPHTQQRSASTVALGFQKPSHTAGQTLLLFLHSSPAFFCLTLTWEEVAAGAKTQQFTFFFIRKKKMCSLQKTTVALGPVWPAWKWECNHIENENDGLRLSLSATFKWSNPAPIAELFDSVDINSNPPPFKWELRRPVRDVVALLASRHQISDASSIRSIQTVSLFICLVSTFNRRVTEKCWYKRHKSRMIRNTKRRTHTHIRAPRAYFLSQMERRSSGYLSLKASSVIPLPYRRITRTVSD